jgi:putative ABC transport system permease protein
MTKLILSDIKKTYRLGNETVPAVNGVSLRFRQSEFVSILGPSGCGKTTFLNVIGGLDQYDSGDLIINGLSTKKFKNADWDAYRNRSIGFVFQNYNLISHQSVLHNVEISMTLSGVSVSERKRRAIEALKAVGLVDQLKKKPAQMSGGQMQRVAIARALVNNPDIILADEPTGALDSHTSEQVMDILKEISKTRLVIMVTHNSEIAEKYSNRIIRMLDGEIQSDSNPLAEDKTEAKPATVNGKAKRLRKTSMSMVTAASLSYKNLLTKRGRTLITSFAGSIGIIGVALVLALSSGLSAYMETMQSDTLAGFPITITRTAQTLQVGPRDGNGNLLGAGDDEGKFPDDNLIYNYDSQGSTIQHTNNLTDDYLDYIAALPDSVGDAVNNISYTRGVGMNVLAKGSETVVLYSSTVRNDDSFQSQAGAMMGGGTDAYWQEMPDNYDYILSMYDLIGEGSHMPENKNEVLLVVNEYNQIDKAFFEKIGISSGESYQMNDFIGKQLLTVVPNDEYYTRDGDLFTSATGSDYEKLFDGESGVHLTVSGILRIKEDAATNYFSEGFVYTPELTNHIVLNAQQSEIALAQIESDKNVITGVPFADGAAKEQQLLLFGADTTPTGISIYPKNFESKEQIKDYLDAYNENKPDEGKIIYTDMAEMITSVTGTLLDTVSYVLIGFAAISLLVSTIMIAIITYVSVIERTKEIGVLRAVGARKKDISRVFNAETMIIGLTAGMFGVGLTYLLSIPINIVIERLVGISRLALLNPGHAIILILGSIALTLIAGFIPSRMAAEKDPVEALRTE